MRKRKKQFVPGRTVAVAFGSIALSVFALLLWGKLKLVTGVPRTAYAVPEQGPVSPPPRTPRPAPKRPAPEASAPTDRPDVGFAGLCDGYRSPRRGRSALAGVRVTPAAYGRIPASEDGAAQAAETIAQVGAGSR